MWFEQEVEEEEGEQDIPRSIQVWSTRLKWPHSSIRLPYLWRNVHTKSYLKHIIFREHLIKLWWRRSKWPELFMSVSFICYSYPWLVPIEKITTKHLVSIRFLPNWKVPDVPSSEPEPAGGSLALKKLRDVTVDVLWEPLTALLWGVVNSVNCRVPVFHECTNFASSENSPALSRKMNVNFISCALKIGIHANTESTNTREEDDTIVRHSSPRRSSPQTFITPYLFSDIHHLRHSSPPT